MPSSAQQLAQWLTGYVPADDVEAGHRAAMATLLLDGESAFSRDHFVPGHFTASSYVLSPDSTQILLIYHSKLHRWLQPGGHFEPTDGDVVAAALREVREETGLVDLELLAAPLDLDVHAIPARKADPQHLHFDVRLLFRAATRNVMAGDDASACQWVALSQVGTVESDDSVLRAVRRILSLGLGRL